VDYCVQADLYSFGLPRGSLPNPAHLAASTSVSLNAINLDQHGLALNDPITLRAESGGNLPAPLLEATRYYAIPLTDSAFCLAATADGSAIDLTSTGMHVLVIFPNPIAAAIRWASRIIDQAMVAHPVPLVAPLPEIVTLTCAELAAAKALGLSGGASKSLTDMAVAAQARIEKWAKGVPLRGDNRPPPANVAATASVPFRDSRGWNKFGGIS
jgi:hypothetical protein